MKIEIGLSPSSIRKAIEQIKEYRESLDAKCEEFVKKLADYGVERAKAYVVSLDAVFEGELLGSIHAEEKNNAEEGCFAMAVKADSEHAIFVELGTGDLGVSRKNAVNAGKEYIGNMPSGYVYGGGTSGKKLTKPFKGHKAGAYGWFYFKNGEWWFCEGMESRPFMYNASVDMREQIEILAKEVFLDG